jgi:hypothetical protein
LSEQGKEFTQTGFRVMDLRDDPLQGAYGLPWYCRKPSSLTQDEWRALDGAVKNGVIPDYEYFDWKENVR